MANRGRVHDRELLDALEELEPEVFSGVVWRTAFVSRDPLVGSAHGGRWHPRNTFEALYTSLDQDGSLAEIYHHLSRAPVFSSKPVQLFELRVESVQLLRLDDYDLLRQLGLKDPAANSVSERSQAIGAAAHFLELQGMLVPSTRWQCLNLVLFLDRIDIQHLSIESRADVNWPAWKEQHAPQLIKKRD